MVPRADLFRALVKDRCPEEFARMVNVLWQAARSMGGPFAVLKDTGVDRATNPWMKEIAVAKKKAAKKAIKKAPAKKGAKKAMKGRGCRSC